MKRVIFAVCLLVAACAPSAAAPELTPEDPEWWDRGSNGCPTYIGSPECPITPCPPEDVRTDVGYPLCYPD